MDVVVVGKHTDVDSALRALTVEKVERVAKFASDVRRVDVDYAQHPTRRADDSHACEILVHVRQHLVKASAAGAEHVIALERALDKVEEQMRRLHERRVGRRNGSRARGARAEVTLIVEAYGQNLGRLDGIEQFDVAELVLLAGLGPAAEQIAAHLAYCIPFQDAESGSGTLPKANVLHDGHLRLSL